MVDLSGGTLLVQFINFFILVAILAKFAYKPLLQIMEERRVRIANDLDGAQKARTEAEKLMEDYKQQLVQARQEGQDIINKAIKQAEVSAQEQLHEVRQQIMKDKERAQEEIAREREKALYELRAEVVNLSVEVAKKVLKKEIDASVNDRLVAEAIEKLDSKKAGL